MGVDLIGHGGLSINWHGWRSCLDLAVAFGWEPAGTLAPTEYGDIDTTGDYPDWKGDYFFNEWQRVTEDDSKALARALYRAVSALRTGLDVTKEQSDALRNVPLSLASELADYAVNGSFRIG